MKTSTKRQSFNPLQQRGFALIVTLSLMILLTVIAVGLLTLSSISLRSSGQGNAMATARANARMALMLAIGDLQKYAGPDQRVTARADVTDENIANPRLTGVWKSWNMQASDDSSTYQTVQGNKKVKSDGANSGLFLGWLASSLDGKSSSEFTFPANPKETDPKKSVTLWGKGSLGPTVTAKDIVTALKVPTSPNRGSFAYAVMDEGVKVRINTPFANVVSANSAKGPTSALLGSGQRPNSVSIPALSKLEDSFFDYNGTTFATIQKGITPSNLALAAKTLAPGTDLLLKPLLHDVSSNSIGLFTNTASGGLKEDFNLLTNLSNLPAPYNTGGAPGTGVYSSLLGISTPSDPKWESFLQLARIYRDNSKLAKSPTGTPLLTAQTPANWNAVKVANGVTTANRVSPPGLVLLPTIAKLQLLFSLVGRDLYGNLPAAPIMRPLTTAEKANGIHGPQDGHFRPTRYDYDLHLLYTPIVTLHNPYNVALQFSNMQVNFLDVPFSMQVFRNNVAQSSEPIAMDAMRVDNASGQDAKPFGMTLKTTNGGLTSFTLLPGEVKMFSPYIEPSLNYLNRGSFWDIHLNNNKNLTANIEAIPGWRGDGIGFDCDWLAGDRKIDGIAANGHWSSCYGLAWDDQIHVEFAPKGRRTATKFLVQVKATTSSGTAVVNAIEMDYQTNDGLLESLKRDGVKFPLRYPKDSGTILRTSDLVDRASTPLSGLKFVKPFALLSVQGKTTSGGRDVSNEDGRLATKPWSFGHANIGASYQTFSAVNQEHSASQSHEIDLQVLANGTKNLFQYDPQDRGIFITGNSSFNGVKFGAMYDIPLTPLQSLVSLNAANPGGSSGYLPRFSQPIGNSWAHPMLDPGQTSTTLQGATPYSDHSFLLNLALYDRFYFSGLADQTGNFATGKTTTSLIQEFTDGKPLSDPRVAFYQPDGKPITDLTSVVNAAATAHSKIAAWQVMNGAFNVNSTSVPAWKAMLGSIHDTKSVVNKLNKTAKTSSFADLPPTDISKGEARISRFRLPASESATDLADPLDAYWLGPREYSDAELESLAQNIVKQIRARGPFLSMAEFVNRQLGSASDEKSQRGALQQAIDDSNLNESVAATANAGYKIDVSKVGSYKYKNAAAGAGSSSQGAPGYLSQADVLTVLGNASTPRSDTFTIRAYGEARDASNNPTATAICEAVIQRVPEFIDSTDRADIAPALLTSVSNKNFGRRFQIVSFRWLNANEI